MPPRAASITTRPPSTPTTVPPGATSPAGAAALADELEHVLSGLDSAARRVLELRLQGHSLEEIAGDTGRSERTVRRALALIRERLAGRLDDDDD